MRYHEAIATAPPGSDRFEAADLGRLDRSALHLLFTPGPLAAPVPAKGDQAYYQAHQWAGTIHRHHGHAPPLAVAQGIHDPAGVPDAPQVEEAQKRKGG